MTTTGRSFHHAWLAAALALAVPALAAPNNPLAPVRELTQEEAAIVAGLPKLSAQQLNLQQAAHTRATAYGKPGPVSAVQRKAGATASTYSVLPATPQGQVPDFIKVGDSAMASASMTPSGVPTLQLSARGDFHAEAMASWHTTLVIPADGPREVFLKLMVPPAHVGGEIEQDHPHRWRARLRAEMLVNGFPAWSTEALRLRTEWRACIGLACQKTEIAEETALVQYGTPLTFPTNDEDTSTANDSNNKDDRAKASARKTVHLSLGRHAAGTRLNLAWMLRGTVWSEPMLANGSDHRCLWNDAMRRYFCSKADLSLHGDITDVPEVRYGP